LIDTASVQTSDMTYTLAADIYIGDVSSQVYEFLVRPRPCVFLNAHGVSWRGNPFYYHWQFGQVVDDMAGFASALERAVPTHAAYAGVQRDALAYTFDIANQPSSARAAEAIYRFMLESARSGRAGERLN
jgi:CDP-glycerol glycerophosphotransferase (TagB/SpsB family)